MQPPTTLSHLCRAGEMEQFSPHLLTEAPEDGGVRDDPSGVQMGSREWAKTRRGKMRGNEGKMRVLCKHRGGDYLRNGDHECKTKTSVKEGDSVCVRERDGEMGRMREREWFRGR